MVPRTNRISKEDFEILKKTKNAQSEHFSIRYRQINEESVAKITVVVSRRISKNATGRNRIKRRFREIIRFLLPRTKKGFLIAIFPKRETQRVKFSNLVFEMEETFKKCAII